MGIGLSVALALAVALAVIGLTFGIARWRGRYDTIDSAWGAGLAVIAVTGFATEPRGIGSALAVTVLTAVWGLRLSAHIHLRNSAHGEDRRYREMYARARYRPVLRMFVRVYLTQAVVMWFVSLPVVLAQQQPDSFGALGVLGVAVWCVGFAFEVVGDEQLRRFKADPANAGEVLDTGLWRYTRHPNYFGDACAWWGLYLIAAQHLPGSLAVLSPLLMTWLLARGSGKPITERHLRDARPGYASYVARTSGFFPLLPKKR
jgi:steroid 5-alpha reductase family enzyme